MSAVKYWEPDEIRACFADKLEGFTDSQIRNILATECDSQEAVATMVIAQQFSRLGYGEQMAIFEACVREDAGA